MSSWIAVVVEQRIVDIDQKNDGVRKRHKRLREHVQVAFEKILFAGCSKRAQRQGARRPMSGGVLLYVDAKSVECNEAYESFSAACQGFVHDFLSLAHNCVQVRLRSLKLSA